MRKGRAEGFFKATASGFVATLTSGERDAAVVQSSGAASPNLYSNITN
ncbi:hypothetical protein [Burkholderia puraquae]|nr:hypothetical protein [Burkholderia puraquae]